MTRIGALEAGGTTALQLPQDGRNQGAGKHGDIPDRLSPPGMLRVHVLSGYGEVSIPS